MKIPIEDKRTNTIIFGNLNMGDCFTANGFLYMKTILLYNEKHTKRFNALNLETRIMSYIEDTKEVQNVTSLNIEII